MKIKHLQKWHIPTPIGVAILILFALGVVYLAQNLGAVNTDDRAKATDSFFTANVNEVKCKVSIHGGLVYIPLIN